MTVNPKLKRLLERVFVAAAERKDDEDRKAYEKRRWEFVFHMTDCLPDLKKLNELYEHPDKAKLKDASIRIIGILYHIIPHLKAAGRLLLDEIPDAFEDSAPRARKANGRPRTSGTRPRRTGTR
jgi:hypothetical protein